MNRYRKKPVVIDAIQWTGVNVQEVMGFANEMVIKHQREPQPGQVIVEEAQKINFDLTAKPRIMLTISTWDGSKTIAPNGWYIICGENGMFYCCDPSVIEKDYDKVHPEYVEDDSPFTFQTCKGCGHFLDSCECSWNFDHKKAKQLIADAKAEESGRPNQVIQELVATLEETLGFDLERRTYYDNFKLVQDDRHKKIAELARVNKAFDRLATVLIAFRESDHSYNRAPTAEGQAVLDVWDEVAKILAK